MNSARITNLELNIDPETKKPPIAHSSRPDSRALSAKSTNRSNSARARPVIHEPCSSTLGKFHDSVNYSLVGETTSRRGSNTPRSNHPILEAKQKYKYMAKQKSFVDESLFGGNSTSRGFYPSSDNTPDIYQYSKTHVTHDIMSNVAPLQIRVGLHSSRSGAGSARVDSARSNKPDDSSKLTKENNTPNDVPTATYQINKPKPWRP